MATRLRRIYKTAKPSPRFALGKEKQRDTKPAPLTKHLTYPKALWDNNTVSKKEAGTMNIPAFKIAELAEEHKDALKALSFQLATIFDVPAQRLINRAISRMGIDRVTYERIVAYQNNWEYTPVPERLLQRWATY
jgi:hypothetical protein